MKFGVREICDVVLRAKAAQKIGNKIFYKNEPVIYFDTLKTSSMEGAATTVYAQGGRGNARLVAWEGERTITFTMEDALISPEGFMILSGAGLIEASKEKTIKQHVTQTIDVEDVIGDFSDGVDSEIQIPLKHKPYLGTMETVDGVEKFIPAKGNFAYVMFMKDGEIISEPFIPVHENVLPTVLPNDEIVYYITVKSHEIYDEMNKEEVKAGKHVIDPYVLKSSPEFPFEEDEDGNMTVAQFDSVLVDYYVEHEADAQQIEITADKFGGNYYLEASTLFRNQNGVDMPAEFIIPNCKIQSNFNFTMASSGDPSTFTFTMDAFPDYTRFDHSKKVLAAIQIIKNASAMDIHRHSTVHEEAHDRLTF